MTVASEVSRSGPYNGNGVATVFDYDFKIVDRDHLRVIKADANGDELTLTIDADYDVSGVGAAEGSIAVSAAPVAGETITILRNVPLSQETDLENQGPYFAETIEAAFDLAAMRDQQLQEQLTRAVLIPASSDDSGGALAAELALNITRLGQSADEIDTVASIKNDVETVAGISSDVALLADNSAILSGTASAVYASENVFVGDGVDTTWTLSTSPASEANVDVWIGGAIQKASDFVLVGNVLTIAPAVANGVEIIAKVRVQVSANDIYDARDLVLALVQEIEAATFTDSDFLGLTTAEKFKMGEVQNLWSDGVVNQIVSDIKGTSFVKSFLQGGTGSAYLTTIEPLHRTQAFTEVNVYNFGDPSGYKGLTKPVKVTGHAHQYVFGPKAFDKLTGDMIEIHDKSPNGGEHFGLAIHYYQHADRKDASINNPNTGGFFPINQVADSWGLWMLGSDMGHHANLFLMELNIRNEWGMRPETNLLHQDYMPQGSEGFQVIQQIHPDFSQYHVTRAISIVPSNSWGNTIGDGTRFVGWETGIFVSGYAKYGLVFGKSIPYANPHDPAGSPTSPTAITFASNDPSAMSFWYDGIARFTLAKLDTDALALVRNSDGKHFWATSRSTGRILLGNANAWVDMDGHASFKNLSSNGKRFELGRVRIVPTTGFNAVMSGSYSDLLVDPASDLATGTVTLPSGPTDGQVAAIAGTRANTVAALTVIGGGGIPIAGAPASLSNGTPIKFIYFATQNAWYRVA